MFLLYRGVDCILPYMKAPCRLLCTHTVNIYLLLSMESGTHIIANFTTSLLSNRGSYIYTHPSDNFLVIHKNVFLSASYRAAKMDPQKGSKDVVVCNIIFLLFSLRSKLIYSPCPQV